MLACAHLTTQMHWRVQGRTREMHPQPQSNVSRFHAVYGKEDQNTGRARLIRTRLIRSST